MQPEEKAALVAQGQTLSTHLQAVQGFQVSSPALADRAAEMARLARANWKALEEKRKSITVPLLAAKNAADAVFRPSLDALAEIERTLKAKVGAYHAAVEAERRAALRASVESVAQGIVPTAEIPEPPRTEGVTVKQVWSFEVVDPDAVPRELCSPDEEKIQKAIWYANTPDRPPQEIPGVRFFLRERTILRG